MKKKKMKKIIKILIMETKRKNVVNKIYLKNSKIVFVVFALNDKKSYQEVDFWINSTKEALEEGKYIMALVANKSDLYNEQEVTDEEVKKRADELNIDFVLT